MTVPEVRRQPLQARSRARYEQICDASLQLLRDGGIGACTMAAVAVQAQLKPTSLYRYFPNVDSLLYAVASRQLDEIHVWLSAHLSGVEGAEQVVEATIQALNAYEQLYRSDPAMRAIWAGSLASPVLIELNIEDSRRNGALIAERINSVRETPVPPERAFLFTHLIGAAVLLLLQLPSDEADVVRAELHRLVLQMVFD